jgi:hypothetical protein
MVHQDLCPAKRPSIHLPLIISDLRQINLAATRRHRLMSGVQCNPLELSDSVRRRGHRGRQRRVDLFPTVYCINSSSTCGMSVNVSTLITEFMSVVNSNVAELKTSHQGPS